MRWYIITLFALSCRLSSSFADDAYVINNRTFPKGFKFGLATAAYQVEGAWNESGKGESIWDYESHHFPERYSNGDNADISSDCYHKTKEDVALLKDFGVTVYRFSIAWTRIYPTGYPMVVNQAGIQYYKDLIAELKANNIEPVVTMYHWDIPQSLQDLGGWMNEVVIDYFVKYARVLLEEFGDDVKFWTTFNEPKQICYGSYGVGTYAPSIRQSGIGDYLCSHNLLKAHAKVYRMYDQEFRAKQKGRMGMVIDLQWYEADSNSTEDQEAAETMRMFHYGWQAHPIFFGDYPQQMKDRIALRSKLEGFEKSRLPEFTEEEKAMLNGSADYLAVNMYTAYMASSAPEAEIGSPSYDKDHGVHYYHPDDWESTVSDWFKVTPWAARSILKWLKDTYNNPQIYITENGYVDDGNVDDMDTRGRFHKNYLSNVLDAIYYDDVNVAGYMAWSLLDNFEWQTAFTKKLGFYHVDFNDPNRTRTPKASQAFYKKVCQTMCLVDKCVDE